MQGCVRKDASATSFLTFERSKVWLGEHEKSTENNGPWLAPVVLATVILVLHTSFAAQDPPSAPVSQGSAGFSRANLRSSRRTHKRPPAKISPTADHVEDSAVNYVFLPVTVKDSEGRLVPDLTRNEFRVLDDNVEQRIEFSLPKPFRCP